MSKSKLYTSGETGAGTNWIEAVWAPDQVWTCVEEQTPYVVGNGRWYLSDRNLCVSQFRSGRVAKKKLGTSGYPANSLVTILKQLLTPSTQRIPIQHFVALCINNTREGKNAKESEITNELPYHKPCTFC